MIIRHHQEPFHYMALSFEFVAVLAVVYGASYCLKPLEDYNIPVLAVQILAGILAGSIFGVISPTHHGYDFLITLAAFALLLIMFDAGLELNPGLIKSNPKKVGILGVLTFVFPFLAGVGLAFVLDLTLFAAFLVGVTVSTTSLGLVHPLLDDFGLLQTENGQMILSVTVLNDILSVVALAYGITIATSEQPLVDVAIVTAVLIFFFLIVPTVFADRLNGTTVSRRLKDEPIKAGILVAVVFAAAMEAVGIHAILGGFFAGLFIEEVTHEGHAIEQSVKPAINMISPAFFFFVGMQFDPTAFVTGEPILIGAVLLLGIGAKVIGAFVGGWIVDANEHTIHLLASSMPGRLSISVAAAEIGLARGIISDPLYKSFIILSTVSVFIAALLFRHFANGDVSEDAATKTPNTLPDSP